LRRLATTRFAAIDIGSIDIAVNRAAAIVLLFPGRHPIRHPPSDNEKELLSPPESGLLDLSSTTSRGTKWRVARPYGAVICSPFARRDTLWREEVQVRRKEAPSGGIKAADQRDRKDARTTRSDLLKGDLRAVPDEDLVQIVPPPKPVGILTLCPDRGLCVTGVVRTSRFGPWHEVERVGEGPQPLVEKRQRVRRRLHKAPAEVHLNERVDLLPSHDHRFGHLATCLRESSLGHLNLSKKV
jgi:hypothetical protein